MTQNFKKTIAQISAVRLLAGAAVYILLYGGSRSGKTFIIVRSIVIRALKAPESRHVILRFRFNHVKQSVWYDTLPKVMKACFPDVKYKENKSDWFIELQNGSQIWFGGLDDKERTEKILGNEYATMYFNECSQIPYDSFTTALTRLAQKTELKNKVYLDCNPPSKKHWVYSIFFKHIDPETKEQISTELYAQMRMNPEDNAENLPDGYIKTTLDNLPERKRKRFKDGVFLDDNERALWKREHIDKYRISHKDVPESLEKICVAIDPAVTSKPESDDTGISVSGRGKAPRIHGIKSPEKEHFYVFEDLTMKGSPLEWGKEAIEAYERYKADRVIGETNNGGDLIETNLRNIDRNVPYAGVHASRGKMVRAEPVAGLYEQGRVHHVGTMPELEEEMCEHEFTTTEPSPNRLDALVWGISWLAGFGGSAGVSEISLNQLGL